MRPLGNHDPKQLADLSNSDLESPPVFALHGGHSPGGENQNGRHGPEGWTVRGQSSEKGLTGKYQFRLCVQ